MSTVFNTAPKTVGELLGNNLREHIVVPTFQRGYEWGKKHVVAFWKDIEKFVEERAKTNGPSRYFLGPIVTLESEGAIHLLDGQQRLATTTILLSVLRDHAKDITTTAAASFARNIQTQLIQKETGFALQLGEMDAAYFEETIQKESPTRVKAKIRTHRNIEIARKTLWAAVQHVLAGANPQAKLNLLGTYVQVIRSDLVMACIPVHSERDAYRIFETLNDRGLRLSVPDLLLNYLMREVKSPEDRTDVRAKWTGMLQEMGKKDINRFLRHMWISKYGDLKRLDLFTAIKERIEGGNIDSLEFVRSCSEECGTYVQLITFERAELGCSADLVRRLIAKLDAQAALPLLLSTFGRLPASDFERMCRLAIVFVTRHSVIGGLDPSNLETVLFELAQKARGYVEGNPPRVKECLREIKDAFVQNSPSDEQLEVMIKELVLEPDVAGYVLERIACHLQSTTKEVTIDEANLEHVFPQNPKPNEWGGSRGQEKLGPYLWHVGNLTILGVRINAGAANAEFSEKMENYYSKSELKINKNIRAQNWNERAIRDRAGELVAPALAVWNFDNPSRV